MPAVAIDAAKWILPQILQSLQSCKMYPVILSGMGHQEELRSQIA